MVKAIRGADATVKQIILHINESRRFIIEDLDETHVFVDASNENTYQLDVVGA
ncbi:hypothetical protein BDF19DRAFT_439613 [Syncephalis fuscata]|nr:hypothetical protein BDF19DRAFT_439613 [Syncephalis fuscata]